MVYRYVCNGFLRQIRLESYQPALPVPRILVLCNHLQNVVATTYIFRLQLSTFIFYNKQNDRKLPIQKIGMSDIIPCEEDMFFEVNNGRGNGAIIAYLFEDELKKLAKEHGGLYVSFSSIDTLMIFPNDRIPCGDKEIILKELTEVVLQANDEMPENLLGTKAYYFDPEHGFEF